VDDERSLEVIEGGGGPVRRDDRARLRQMALARLTFLDPNKSDEEMSKIIGVHRVSIWRMRQGETYKKSLESLEALATDQVKLAMAKLMAAAPGAADVLIGLAEREEVKDGVRFKAADAILDKVGVVPHPEGKDTRQQVLVYIEEFNNMGSDELDKYIAGQLRPVIDLKPFKRGASR